MKGIKSSVQKRKNNLTLETGVKDLEISIFSSLPGQKKKTYVPILARNFLEHKDRGLDLLSLKWDKSPLGKPFVFSESYVEFQSIEITFYPEAISQIYQIFLVDSLILK